MLQLKQLITDPAVNREFMRLASLAKSASMESGALREELRTLHFVSNDPKGPRSLVAQIKSLESKIKMLSAEALDSKASSLETALKLSEDSVSDLKRKNHVLEEKIQVLMQDKDALEKELITYRHPNQAKRPSGGDGGRRRGRGRGSR
jgi:chromosome segregation ATPase